MAITEIEGVKPSAPNTLTSESASTPLAPNNLNELTGVKPDAPINLAEITASEPLAPNNLTEIAGLRPSAANNLTEVTALDLSAPNNLTEITALEPVVPNNLTEVSRLAPTAPNNLTEIQGGMNRTIEPIFNFNSEIGLPSDVTFTRASSASYVETFRNQYGQFEKRVSTDYVGNVTNLATQSNNFVDSDWVKSNASIATSNQKLPNGDSVYKLIEGVGSSITCFITNSISFTSGNTYTFSYTAKKGTFNSTRISFPDSAFPASARAAIFDLENGAFSSIDTGLKAGAKYLGDGYWSVYITQTADATTTGGFAIQLADNGVATIANANADDFIFFANAQLTQSDKPLPYVKTLSTSVTQAFTASPRIEKDGLLIEGASTNLMLHSEDFTASGWSALASTIATNQAQAPDGSYTANSISGTTDDNVHQVSRTATLDDNSIYAVSIYAKAGSLSVLRIAPTDKAGTTNNTYFDLSTGTVLEKGAAHISAYMLNMGNGWYRCSITFDSLSGASNNTFRFGLSDGVNPSFVSSSTENILIWGAQIEKREFATSYIRTTSAAVTRSAETPNIALSVTGEFTIFIEAAYPDITPTTFSARRALSFNGGTNANRVLFYNFNQSPSGVVISIDGVNLPAIQSPDIDNSNLAKAAITKSASQYDYYYNGQFVQSVLNHDQPTLSNLDIGHELGGESIYGNIKRIAIYPKALTASEVKAL